MNTVHADPGAIDLRQHKARPNPVSRALRDNLTYEEVDELIAAVEALRARVDDLLTKFDDCRAALARRVEQDTGLHAPPDSNTQEWHEWLIEESDKGTEVVKALREDLAGYETVFNLAQKRERPWIEAWRKATSKPDTLPDYGEMLGWLCDRTEATEAHMAALAGAANALLKERSVNTLEEAAREYPHGKEAVAEVLGVFDNLRTVLAATPAQAVERVRAVEWQSIEESNPPRHETVLFLCSNGDIYQGRGCYGMHAPWWCGHGVLNFGKILSDEGLTVTHWKPKDILAKLNALGKEEKQ